MSSLSTTSAIALIFTPSSLVAGSLGAGPAFADDGYTVCASGCAYTTIEAAIFVRHNKEKRGRRRVRVLLSGLSGTGSTTAAKRIASDFNLRYYYGGQMFRNLAMERGIALEDLAKSLETDQETEREIDRRLIYAGMENDNVLIESRTMGWIFPREIDSVRVWLTCDLRERLNRVERREHHSRSRENLLLREASDNARYAALYGIDPEDSSPFDLVLDTTYLTVDQVVEEIEGFLRGRHRSSEQEVVRTGA